MQMDEFHSMVHNRRESYLFDLRGGSCDPIHLRDAEMLQRQELRKVGLKVTLPRLKILEILENSVQRHLSAEDIYKKLLESGDDIGLATVYRVLTQFEVASLVTRHNFEEGHSVFELDQGEHHDHMVCIETGDVVEFVNDEIEALQTEIAKKHNFEIVDHSLVLYVKPLKKDDD
jgi:Fur family ferric uptake transcriptional regulator